jgi:predicted  nucleic acid-binding Zn-ribbon protein
MTHDQLVVKHRAALLAWNAEMDASEDRLAQLYREAGRLDADRERHGEELEELEEDLEDEEEDLEDEEEDLEDDEEEEEGGA